MRFSGRHQSPEYQEFRGCRLQRDMQPDGFPVGLQSNVCSQEQIGYQRQKEYLNYEYLLCVFSQQMAIQLLIDRVKISIDLRTVGRFAGEKSLLVLHHCKSRSKNRKIRQYRTISWELHERANKKEMMNYI